MRILLCVILLAASAPAQSDQTTTLRIEAALIYQNGDVKPVARKTFSLLAPDAMAEIEKLPRAGEYKLDGLAQLRGTCEREYPALTEIISKRVRYQVTTGFDGKAELRGIAPGQYWLFGQTLTRDYCITWFMHVDLTKDQSVILDQHGAI